MNVMKNLFDSLNHLEYAGMLLQRKIRTFRPKYRRINCALSLLNKDQVMYLYINIKHISDFN